MQGFKVVRKEGKKLFSFNAPPMKGRKDSVRYKVRCVTKPYPGCGPLALFTTLEEAKKFIEGFDSDCLANEHCIYKCRYEPSNEDHLWFEGTFMIKCQLRYLRLQFPGTILASSITLTKKVAHYSF